MIELSSRGILKPDAPQIALIDFGLDQLSMMSASAELNDPQQFLEAICSTVSNYKPEELTVGDLLQIAVYHRIKAFPNSPISVSWKCKGILYRNPSTSELHRAEEISQFAEEVKETLEPYTCNSDNVVKYDVDTFPIMVIPENVELDHDLQIPNATLYPEIVKLSANPATAKLANAAAWVKAGATLQEKLEIIGNQETLDLFDRASKASKTYQHGPYSRLRSECPNCGTEVMRRITINANSFFR